MLKIDIIYHKRYYLIMNERIGMGTVNERLWQGQLKVALRAAARITGINLKAAESAQRHNPLLGEEVMINQELINLKESYGMSRASQDTILRFPSMYQNLMQDQGEATLHSIGLIGRMIHGQRLPQTYSKRDTLVALTTLVRLVVGEAVRCGKRLDDEIIEVVRPYLTLRQRKALKQRIAFDMNLQFELTAHRFQSIWS
jgi:hypothetical protein